MKLQRQTQLTSKSSKKAFDICKRIFDILISLMALLILAPFLIVIAVIIKIEDGGKIIFKQKRAGLNQISFNIYKFRSMKENVKKEKKSTNTYEDWVNGVPDDFVFKATDNYDPNVTKFGRLLRKFSLDELPQFLNVLKGDMSIIGPRPEIIDITDRYNAYQKKRLYVKPGITGWAQVNGRSNINHGSKIYYDLFYVENRSFYLDLKIILMTIKQVLFGKGAI